MALTRVRASQIIGLTGQYAPIVNTISDTIFTPSTPNVVRLYGVFFTPDMTVEIEGVNNSISNFIFIDTTEVELTIQAGSTEGDFDLILNNGIERVKSNAISIILGDAFIPSSSDWINVNNNLDVSEGTKAKIKNFDQWGIGYWDKSFDYTKNFSFRFNPAPSPLGDVPRGSTVSYNQDIVSLRKVSNDAVVAAWGLYYHHPSNAIYSCIRTSSDGWQYSHNYGGIGLAAWDIMTSDIFEFRYLNDVLYFYRNGGLLKTFALPPITEAIRLRVYTSQFDIENIKYIELPL